MNYKRTLRLLAAGLLLAFVRAGTAHAGTTIDPFNKYAYGANIG